MFTDIFDRIRKSTGGPIGQYREKAEGYFAFPRLEGDLGPYMKFNGQDVLCWSLNNYLGLANHPEIRKVDAEAAARWGLAYPMGSRMMTGQTHLHEELERRLAAFEKKEAAFEFNFGYQGIVSTIDSLVCRHDVIVYDAEDHACLLDGIRLHIGSKYKFRHNDIVDCERVLALACEEAEKRGGGVLLITEGVFGMTGALGILDQIAALKKKYKFRIMIDDAHGFGVMGEHGRGTSEHFGVMDEIDIYIGAYAKSMAIIGGFVAADKDIIDYLKYNMRSQIYAKSLPMPIVEGCLKRLEIIDSIDKIKSVKEWCRIDSHGSHKPIGHPYKSSICKEQPFAFHFHATCKSLPYSFEHAPDLSTEHICASIFPKKICSGSQNDDGEGQQ